QNRLVEQSIGERANVEAGAAHYHRTPSVGATLRDPFRRIAREPPRTVALTGLEQIQPAMRHPRHDVRARLGGPDVETAIELAGVGRDDSDALQARERDGDGGLADARGAHNHRCEVLGARCDRTGAQALPWEAGPS